MSPLKTFNYGAFSCVILFALAAGNGPSAVYAQPAGGAQAWFAASGAFAA